MKPNGPTALRLDGPTKTWSEEAARAASKAAATAGGIFNRRDPVRTLAIQPQIVEVLSTIFDPEIPVRRRFTVTFLG